MNIRRCVKHLPSFVTANARFGFFIRSSSAISNDLAVCKGVKPGIILLVR